MKDKGVRGSELAWAKKSLNNNFIFSFQSVDQIAYQQMMIEYDTLPQNFLFTYRKKIGEVSEEDINHTAARYFTSQNFVTLVLGNETAFDKPLSSLGKIIKID
jgi:predicted Zn-dependent peptidase